MTNTTLRILCNFGTASLGTIGQVVATQAISKGVAMATAEAVAKNPDKAESIAKGMAGLQIVATGVAGGAITVASTAAADALYNQLRTPDSEAALLGTTSLFPSLF